VKDDFSLETVPYHVSEELEIRKNTFIVPFLSGRQSQHKLPTTETKADLLFGVVGRKVTVLFVSKSKPSFHLQPYT